jgi:hypothetical protein
MLSSTTRQASLWAAILLPGFLGGCIAPEQPREDTTEVVNAPLAAYDFSTWTAWTMPVDVCFLKDTNLTPTAAQYTSLQSTIMAGLQQTWGQVPGVSFVSHGDCGAIPPSNYLHLVVHWEAGAGGVCGAGVGTTCHFGGATDTQSNIDFLKQVATHEVGHGLGLAHEHQRVDANSCEKALADACVRCKQSIDANQSCAAADWNTCNETHTCVATTPLTPAQAMQTCVPLNQTPYQKMAENIGNNAAIATLQRMTAYDPDSIMNYCRQASGYQLTPLDLLGLEMIYPLNVNYPIGCSDSCFYANGGVITRQDHGAVTTSWMTRGALNVTLIDPVTSQQGTTIATQHLAAGSSQLTFRFIAPRTQQRLTTTGTLVNSDATHTALLMTASSVAL